VTVHWQKILTLSTAVALLAACKDTMEPTTPVGVRELEEGIRDGLVEHAVDLVRGQRTGH
jgi:hypothetical protein